MVLLYTCTSSYYFQYNYVHDRFFSSLTVYDSLIPGASLQLVPHNGSGYKPSGGSKVIHGIIVREGEPGDVAMYMYIHDKLQVHTCTCTWLFRLFTDITAPGLAL